MGARMIRRWILFPLRDTAEINKRLDTVEYFFRDPQCKQSLRNLIAGLGDFERICSKTAVGRVSPREIVQLKTALFAIGEIKRICEESELPNLKSIGAGLSAGYTFMINERLNLELGAGLWGGRHFKYSQYDSSETMNPITSSPKNFIAIDNITVAFMYIF